MTKEPEPKPKITEIPQILQTALQQKIATVKTAAQQTYHQVIDKTVAAVDQVDTWAVDQVNNSLDKVAESVDRQRQEAQLKLQKGLKQTQDQAKLTGDRLKNRAQSVFKKIQERF